MAKKKPKDTTGTGEDQGLVGQARHDIAGAYDTISNWLSDPGSLDPLARGGGGSAATPAKSTGPTLPQEEAQVKKLQGELKSEQSKKTAEDAYQQLADTQANQYLNMTKALDPLTSGASLPAIESTASQNASQMLGASSSSPVSQWLNAQTQAAQAQNVPAGEAQAQVAAAQDNAAGLVAGGLKNMGSAEAQMMQAAPYQQLLSSLAADVPYKLLSGYTLPQIQTTLQQSEQGLGLSTTGNPTVPTPALPALSSGIIPPAPTPTTYPGVS